MEDGGSGGGGADVVLSAAFLAFYVRKKWLFIHENKSFVLKCCIAVFFMA